VTTVRKEYKSRLTDVFNDHNPDKVDNVPAILSKHGNNLHSIYLKVCKKYDRPSEPEYSGPTKGELEEAIEM
jgi:ribosomal protein S17E